MKPERAKQAVGIQGAEKMFNFPTQKTNLHEMKTAFKTLHQSNDTLKASLLHNIYCFNYNTFQSQFPYSCRKNLIYIPSVHFISFTVFQHSINTCILFYFIVKMNILSKKKKEKRRSYCKSLIRNIFVEVSTP